MKATIINFRNLTLMLFLGFAAFLTACSDDGILSPRDPHFEASDNPPAGITVTVRKHQSGRGYVFDLHNNTSDTIVNDFHVIFDSTVKITGWNIARNWQIDPNSTDTGKGKFGIKAGTNGIPIPPGQVAENLLWVELNSPVLRRKIQGNGGILSGRQPETVWLLKKVLMHFLINI